MTQLANKDNIDKSNKNKQQRVWGGAAERRVREGVSGKQSVGTQHPSLRCKARDLTLHPARCARGAAKPGPSPACSQSCRWSWFPSAPGDPDPPNHTGPQGERRRRTETICSGRGARSAPQPYAPLLHLPNPQAPGQPLAGRGGGGAGCRAAWAQKAEPRSTGARSVSRAQCAAEKAGVSPDPEEPRVLARPA